MRFLTEDSEEAENRVESSEFGGSHSYSRGNVQLSEELRLLGC
jgi:hypothetical protein